MEPESKVLGATFDALDSVDSDPGPTRMRLMDLKWPHDFRRIHRPRVQLPLKLMNRMTSGEAHESKVLALGPTFDQLNALD